MHNGLYGIIQHMKKIGPAAQRCLIWDLLLQLLSHQDRNHITNPRAPPILDLIRSGSYHHVNNNHFGARLSEITMLSWLGVHGWDYNGW